MGSNMSRCVLALALLPFLVGCVFSSSHAEAHSNASATVIINGSSALSPIVSVIVVRCEPTGGASFEVQGEIEATAKSSVTISASACGSGHEVLGTVSAEAFASAGADAKVRASYAVPMRMRLGAHAVVLCYTRKNGDGTGSYVCSREFDLDSKCPPEGDPDGGAGLPAGPTPGGTPSDVPLEGEQSCRDVAAFGELVGSPSLCTGGGPLHIPVHVRGSFGEAPALTITGPNGYSHQAQLGHSGTSCNYQYNWSTEGNGGSGQYTFAVSGAGRSYSFSASLSCP